MTELERPGVRPATAADAEAMGRVQALAWQATYRGIMPDAYLDAIEVAQRATMWRALIEEADPRRQQFVVERGGAVVGFATCGPARTVAGAGELYAINVEPTSWGLGCGWALLGAVRSWLAERGFTEAVLHVASANGRARRWYEADGWAADGTESTEDVLGAVVHECRYVRVLAAGGGSDR